MIRTMIYTLNATTRLPLPRGEVFDFFSRAENLGRITPSQLGFDIRTPLPIAMKEGTIIDYTIRMRGFPMKWKTRITRWNPGVEFADEQVKGPYALWIHTHRFRDVPGGTEISDTVQYKLPFGVLGRLVHFFVKRELAQIFAYREIATRRLLLGV